MSGVGVPSEATFEEWLFGQGYADRTIVEYLRFMRRLRQWCEARGLDPDGLVGSQVREWAATLPASWASRKNARSAVRHWRTWMGRTDQLEAAIVVPRKPRSRNRALSVEDAARLRDAAVLAGGREGLATMCGLYLAARSGEIARLRWNDWDRAKQTFRFERTKTADWHVVPVHPDLAEALTRFREGHGSHSLYVFQGDRGRAHVTTATIYGWVKHIGELADVAVSPHVLRHTALSTAYDAVKDLRAVQDIAGHRDPSVTSMYTRTTQQQLRNAILAIDYTMPKPSGMPTAVDSTSVTGTDEPASSRPPKPRTGGPDAPVTQPAPPHAGPHEQPRREHELTTYAGLVDEATSAPERDDDGLDVSATDDGHQVNYR